MHRKVNIGNARKMNKLNRCVEAILLKYPMSLFVCVCV